MSAQADAIAEAVHLVQVLLPQFVNRGEDGVALDLFQRFGVLKADLELVGLAHTVRNEIANSELRGSEPVVDRVRKRFLLAGLSRLD